MQDLKIPLKELNQWLTQEELEIELIVIGAFALHLHGYSNRMTMDIDTIKAIEDKKILKQIEKIGAKYGLPHWLNDQADNLTMPPQFEKRLLTDSSYSNIKLFYVARIDLIKLKVAAYFYRGDSDPKDKDDIQSLKVSANELQEALDFLKSHHMPDVEKFQHDFHKRLKIIEKELKNV